MANVSVRYVVDDVDAAIAILLEDPSGNPVELFQPTRREAAL